MTREKRDAKPDPATPAPKAEARNPHEGEDIPSDTEHAV